MFKIQLYSLLIFTIWMMILFVNGSSDNDDEPKVEALIQSKVPITSAQSSDNLPIFPERNDAVYFVVAVAGGFKSWGRIMARTLLDMGDMFGSPLGNLFYA
jgi:hypothetical protein